MVYYDDLFAEEFGSKAVTRVEAIMAVVDEMYDEDDTFKTKLDVETVAIKHATGQNWGTSTNWGSDVLCMGCPAARRIKIKVWCVTSEHYYATVFLELLPIGMECKVDFLAKWSLRSTSWI